MFQVIGVHVRIHGIQGIMAMPIVAVTEAINYSYKSKQSVIKSL